MARIGRNQACPCRSGKKYKKCCWPIHEAAERPPVIGLWEDDLDELSNSVLTLVEQARWDEATAACTRLRERYPDQVDWLARTGHLQEAQGRFEEAADYYRKSAVFASVRPGYGPESVAYYWGQAAEAEAQTEAAV